MYYLHVRALRGEDRRIPLAHGAATIGRRAGNTIVIDRFGVSGRHAEIDVGAGGVVIRDLDSMNGTFVNGDRITDARLDPGDRIMIGSVLIVLQEALSDRILLRAGLTEPGAADAHPAAATGPTRRGARRSPSGHAPGRAREIFVRVMELDDRLLPDDRVYAEMLIALMKETGAAGGFLLGIEPGSRLFLRAASGIDHLLVVDRSLIDEVATRGTARRARGKRVGGADLDHHCLPVGQAGYVTGVLYLLLPSQPPTATARLLELLGPALSALSLVAGRRDAEASSFRVRRAVAEGAEWPMGSPPSGIIDDDLLGHSSQIRFALREIDRLASGHHPVLVRGEPGTGIEQAARRLHALGNRQEQPFFRIDCLLPSTRHLERELFGDGDVPGKLRIADGGTVFFDEIADLPVTIQRHLVDVAGWGGPDETALDVRLVLGTRHTLEELEELVEEGRLVGRLLDATGSSQLRLPPLRERPEDIVPLAQHFMRRSAARLHRRVAGLSSEACRVLRAHPWRGNIRELGAVIHRAVLLATDEILDVEVLPADVVAEAEVDGVRGLGAAGSLPWREAKLAFERYYLENLMTATEGNISVSSRHAGIARKNLYSKLKQHGLLPRDN